MKIPFLNLKKINAPYNEEFKILFDDLLESGHYILGSSLKQFETEFANYCGINHCIGTGNGLDALTLILRGYIELGKLKIGDKVIVAANTYIATIIAIKNAGLVPFLIDPDINTFNLDHKLLPKKLASNTKAIMVTYLYGQLANMEAFRNYCNKNQLLLFSDSAQAHGAKDNLGRRAGSLADASGFSFYPTKNLGALGDGGAVTTNNEELALCIQKLRNYGSTEKYNYEYVGVNSRLDEIQAKFLSIKLKTLDADNKKRQKIALRYINEIKNSKIKLPRFNIINSHVFHQFVITVENRDDFLKYLSGNGIGYLIHYPIPPHLQKAFKNLFNENYPITEVLSAKIVSLPINIGLIDSEVDLRF